MKYSLILAFAASALAQSNATQAATSTGSCIGVVTETVWAYVTTCPCTSPTTTTLATSTTSNGLTTSASTSSGTGIVGPGSASTTTSSSSSGSSSPSSTGSTSLPTTSVIGQPTSIVPSTTPSGSATGSSTSSAPSSANSALINCAAAGLPPAGSTVTSALSAFATADISTRDLYPHNLHRANASIPALTWSTTLAASAQQLANSCIYGHNTSYGGGGYGQNIGAGYGQFDTPAMITNAMYDGEINFYPGPYGSNNIDTSNFESWGHYSQIVWAATTQVGCAWADCSATGLQNFGGNPAYFTVCNYAPPGNVNGAWSNVAAPGGCGTVVWA